MNIRNCNISNGDDNNTRNLPPPTLEHVIAIQGQPFQTMVLMQQSILRMQSTDERTQSRKRKNDTQGDERTKKQLKTYATQQVVYDKQTRHLSEMSPEYTDLSSFLPPSLNGGIQCTTCHKKRTSFWSLPEEVYIMYSLRALWPLFKELSDEKSYPFRVRDLVVKETSWRWH
jgi:hypothetical protein